jgi:hypothetical protein
MALPRVNRMRGLSGSLSTRSRSSSTRPIPLAAIMPNSEREARAVNQIFLKEVSKRRHTATAEAHKKTRARKWEASKP